ncbi:BrnA antitoxin family protein [Pannus brasiliensis CCIBt3594]|uniref:BrnA antitoxin family protein n=1 Tax=Pannus brasiliensis CCIBt3594 TaxID=1427578 RepID=A0AAW9QGF3_9CHRO
MAGGDGSRSLVKVPVTIRLDPAVLAWYKRQVPRGYQTLINAVLEKYMLDREAEIRSEKE